MRYYVYTPGYAAHVGGIVALHRLASLIHECGKECWLVTPGAAENCQVPLIEISQYSKEECPKEFVVDTQGTMAIYPEGVLGNPLGCEKVTRWILRDTGNETYRKSDFIFRYHERQNLQFNKGRYDGFLNVVLFPIELLDSKRRFLRWKIRLVIRKEPRRLMPLNWLIPSMDDVQRGGFNAMVEEISKCLIFISYDTKTGYSPIASYLGALSIVIPNKQTTRKQYHSVPTAEFGIAYGWWDVTRSIWTRGKLRSRLRDLPARNLSQVKNYLEIVEQV